MTCSTCRSPDTILSRENRMFFLTCETCGARYEHLHRAPHPCPFCLSPRRRYMHRLLFFVLFIYAYACPKIDRILSSSPHLFFAMRMQVLCCEHFRRFLSRCWTSVSNPCCSRQLRQLSSERETTTMTIVCGGFFFLSFFYKILSIGFQQWVSVGSVSSPCQLQNGKLDW